MQKDISLEKRINQERYLESLGNFLLVVIEEQPKNSQSIVTEWEKMGYKFCYALELGYQKLKFKIRTEMVKGS